MKSFVLGIIILCYVYGVIWGILFLFGWNKYIFEFVRFICFVEWIGDFLNYFYVIIILFIGFLILVGVIVSLYLLILKKVSWNLLIFILIGKLLLSKFIIFKRKIMFIFLKIGFFFIYIDYVIIIYLLIVGCVWYMNIYIKIF